MQLCKDAKMQSSYCIAQFDMTIHNLTYDISPGYLLNIFQVWCYDALSVLPDSQSMSCLCQLENCKYSTLFNPKVRVGQNKVRLCLYGQIWQLLCKKIATLSFCHKMIKRCLWAFVFDALISGECIKRYWYLKSFSPLLFQFCRVPLQAKLNIIGLRQP